EAGFDLGYEWTIAEPVGRARGAGASRRRRHRDVDRARPRGGYGRDRGVRVQEFRVGRAELDFGGPREVGAGDGHRGPPTRGARFGFDLGDVRWFGGE